MALTYNPKDAVKVWPAKDYDATLEDVVFGQSKTSGADMETWSFRVFNDEGKSQLIVDYVTVPACTFKIKQLAKALGQEQEFNDGQFQAENCIGSGVVVGLTIDVQDGYDDKNKIGKVKPPRPNGDEPTPPAKPPTSSGRSELDIQKMAAFTAFKQKTKKTGPDAAEAMKVSVRSYFGRPSEQVTSVSDWKRFIADGFEKKVANPIDDTQEFDESSIPF